MSENSKITIRKILLASLFLIFFLIVGLFYIFLPYEGIVGAKISLGLSQSGVKVFGVVMIVVGAVLFVLTLITNLIKGIRHYGRKYWWAFALLDVFKYLLILFLAYLLIRGGVGVAESIIQ